MRSAVCGKANGRRCPLFESCGYLAQSHRTHDADVLIVAHEFLFERLPTAVLHDVAYVIIEDDFIPTGDAMPSFPSTCSARTPSAVRPCSIATAKRRRRRQPTCSATRCPIAAMTDGEPEDYVADDALERHHVPQADARYLRYCTEMHPGMSLAERREAQHHAECHGPCSGSSGPPSSRTCRKPICRPARIGARRADATKDAAIAGDTETRINIDGGRTDQIRWPH